MSGIHFLPILPPSLQPLPNTLRTLHLTSCKLGDISMIGKLRNLEILSFCGSQIVEIPSNIAELTRLTLLDLKNCKNLINIAADISKLPDLEKLYLPEYFEFANLVGLNSSSRLTCLQIFISIHHLIPIDQNLLPLDLLQLAQKLTSFNITISSSEERYKPYVRMGSLRIWHEGPIQPLLSDWVKLLLEKTKHLVLDGLKNSNDIFSELSEEGFNELNSLELNRLKGTEYLVNTKESAPQMAFSSLEVLSLSSLRSFIEICPGQLPDKSFHNVRELHGDECDQLLLQGLVRLKYLDVSVCDSLEVLFGHDDEQDAEIAVPCLRSLTCCYKLQNVIEDKKGKQEATSVEFPCLSSISLIHLYKLKSFCTGCYTIKWPSLEMLHIHYCFEMETFGYGDQVTPQLKKTVKYESEGKEIVITINGGDLNHIVQNHFRPKAATLEAGPSQSS
ncbi:uncharacterized protein LOC132304770 [Cornus florida]|uniref:uncharacterized protein LOC132304770 n=1 Tax=Cornus florida TaxID=4283 RepID=UPI00289E8D33|nr:uncharacterized protein LOC132304770 [Cornus florida]